MKLNPWQQRVCEEQHRLNIRVMQFKQFLKTDAFKALSKKARDVRLKQRKAMIDYNNCLIQIIKDFSH